MAERSGEFEMIRQWDYAEIVFQLTQLETKMLKSKINVLLAASPHRWLPARLQHPKLIILPYQCQIIFCIISIYCFLDGGSATTIRQITQTLGFSANCLPERILAGQAVDPGHIDNSPQRKEKFNAKAPRRRHPLSSICHYSPSSFFRLRLRVLASRR